MIRSNNGAYIIKELGWNNVAKIYKRKQRTKVKYVKVNKWRNKHWKQK